MTPREIFTALGARLSAMPDCPPIVEPNRTGLPPMPYLVLQVRSRGDLDPALAGGADYSEGSVVVTVVSELNAATGEADDLAYRVKQQFPRALRLAPSLAIRLASVAGGYADDVSWRVPVTVDYGP